METKNSLLCFQCGSIYDESEKQSVTGSCGHSICKQCHLACSNSNCPICREENSFQELDVNSKLLENLKLLREELLDGGDNFVPTLVKVSFIRYKYTIFIQQLQQKPCSECKQNDSKTRICVDCAKNSEIVMKGIGGRKWIVQCFDRNLFSSSTVLCSDCVHNDHEGHITVVLQNIVNLSDVIKYELFLKLSEKKETIADVYIRYLEQYRSWFNCYFMILEEENNRFEGLNDISDNLKNSFMKTTSQLEDATKKVMKLKQRELIWHQNRLESLIHNKEEEEEEQKEERQDKDDVILKKMKRVNKMFIEIMESGDFDLTENGIEEIDAEIVNRMERLEENYKQALLVEIEMAEDSKFYKYQSLLKEFENSNEVVESFELRSKIKKHTEFLAKMQCKLDSIDISERLIEEQKIISHEEEFELRMVQIKNYRIIIHMEIMEYSHKSMKDSIDLIEGYERLNFSKLMQMKFFPETTDDIRDVIFTTFIDDFNMMNLNDE